VLKEAWLAAKHRNENLTKRIKTLIIKAYNVKKDFDINLAVTLKRNSQYYTYRSIDRSI
jgi:hypothetical protein